MPDPMTTSSEGPYPEGRYEPGEYIEIPDEKYATKLKPGAPTRKVQLDRVPVKIANVAWDAGYAAGLEKGSEAAFELSREARAQAAAAGAASRDEGTAGEATEQIICVNPDCHNFGLQLKVAPDAKCPRCPAPQDDTPADDRKTESFCHGDAAGEPRMFRCDNCDDSLAPLTMDELESHSEVVHRNEEATYSEVSSAAAPPQGYERAVECDVIEGRRTHFMVEDGVFQMELDQIDTANFDKVPWGYLRVTIEWLADEKPATNQDSEEGQ